ncbi:NAD(P)/FAD-dependent oxidoreductase [Polluticaenibacter yanchengensis]|uniref:FAD-dependent oxidoreductase n=1 Tax=Polluticaenibacter yanchengensis TaxID=3014562 RepID=A0ABT4UJT6_9BACT|nr:FAD-dependent oxidoreductase [Chitinophagaceae bacterium LY-5]
MMRFTDTLIIGSGIAGTWLGYWLDHYNHNFVVIDQYKKNAATRVASGVINPVTGRRLAKTWLDERIMHDSRQHYLDFERKFNVSVFSQIELLDFFGAEDKRAEFAKRAILHAQYLRQPSDEETSLWSTFFNYNLGLGVISPVYHIHLSDLLDTWTSYLKASDKYMNDTCTITSLRFEPNKVIFNDNITAKRVIFCDGTNGLANHFFQDKLPFVYNKGEAVIVKIKELPQHFIYKKGFTIVPWNQPGHFWIGSTYNKDFENDLPTDAFYTEVINWLNNFCKHSYEIIDHISALRPTTKERRPFVGFHPDNSLLGVFNGMGTKGVSLSPVFGKEFAGHILSGLPLHPEADVARFFR